MPDQQQPQNVNSTPVQSPAQQPPIATGAIYTMPDKFMAGGVSSRQPQGAPASSGKRSGGKMVLVIGIIALLLGGITAGAYYYINAGGDLFGLFGPTPKPQAPVSATNQPTTNQPAAPVVDQNQNANPPGSVATTTPDELMLTRDAQRVQDVVVLAKALQSYYAQFNAYPQLLQVIPKDILPSEPKDPLTDRLYAYTPRENRQSYSIVIEAEKLLSFNGKSYVKGSWEFYPEDFGATTNTPPAEQPVPTDTDLDNSDADADGLTAAEEAVISTSPSNPDTDGDGYRDNIEFNNFYSPLQSGAIKLDQAGIVKLYTNEPAKYSFFYPSSWVVSAPPTAATDVLITTGTGENFSVSVKDNADSKTSWEWYTQNVSHDYNPNSVSIVSIAGHEAVKTLDGMQAYIAVGTRVFVWKYELNTETIVRYPTLFSFMLGHFTIQ